MTITNRYLDDPAAFPSPSDGEPWGDAELWIDFVGGPYHVTGLSETQNQRLREHFADVCIAHPPAAASAVRMGVRRLSAGLFRPPAPPPRELSFELHAQADHMSVAGESLCARIDCAAATAGTLWTSTEGDFFTRNVFENFFRILVTYRLVEQGGLLLHSAGVVNREQAFLFPGRSGDGKSTLSKASLAEGRSVLSDDMNAVTWRNGEPRVEKVPFTGDLGRTWSRGSDYPLRAILALEKAGTTSVRELAPARAMSLMAACAPFLNSDPFRMPKLLENLQQLTVRTPTHILAFSNKGEIWPVIEEVIQS
jgi:hypothetical protein